MLTFDLRRSQFVLDSVAVGVDVYPAELAVALNVAVEVKPDDAAWCFVQTNDRPVNLFATFFKEQLHSGYFWANVPAAGWDDYERAEATRRVEHERLMEEMFGTKCFESAEISVELLRDPRSGLEQIAFNML